MFFDPLKNWLQHWRGMPVRRAVPRPADAHLLEFLESRFLLGQLVAPTLPDGIFPDTSQEVSLLTASSSSNDGESSRLPPLEIQPIPTVDATVEQLIPQGSTAEGISTANQAESGDTGLLGSALNSEFNADPIPSLQTAATDAKGATQSTKSVVNPTAPQRSELTANDASNGGSSGSSDSNAAGNVAAGSLPGTTAGSTPSTTTPNGNSSGAGMGMSVSTTSVDAGTTVSTATANTSAGVSFAHGSESLAALTGTPQLTTADVEDILDRASAATPSEDAIIAVVDRQGIILGVRTEANVQTADVAKLVFSIDGAVAEARTAAFFANNQAPLTSRTVRFISQTTITEREVNSNPSIADPTSTIAGPGFVAPIGLGGHFPPSVTNTPPVDLFAIEHTNRDSVDTFPGGEGRFNADYVSAAQEINAPGSYGVQSGLMPDAQPRGIATLPGGIPIYNGVLVGGIGVFFPGSDGYASFEQGFVHGDNVSANKRTNAPRVLEAEYIAVTAAPPLPQGRLDLVGITLQTVGPIAGDEGKKQLLKFGKSLGTGTVNGSDQPVSPAATLLAGTAVPTGWLVDPHAGGDLTAADVIKIINQGIAEAKLDRAAIRLPLGSRTRMIFAVTDTDGNVLGLYRMDDATYFSFDVAVAKARNVAYYNDPTAIQPEDRVLAKQDPAVNPKGVAFTARTFRFLAEPRFPAGQDGTKPGPFSILNEPSINPKNAENLGAPAAANTFDTVLGYDSFNIGTNFHDNSSPTDNQNGVIFFPGSSGVYKNGKLVGGLGVSGDGVDQDDVVTAAAIKGFAAPSAIRADRYTLRKVRLPYTKFLRNPRG